MNLGKRITSAILAASIAISSITTVAFAGSTGQSSGGSSTPNIPSTSTGFKITSSNVDPMLRIFAIPSFIRDGNADDYDANTMLNHLKEISKGAGSYNAAVNGTMYNFNKWYRTDKPECSLWVLPTTNSFSADKIFYGATTKTKGVELQYYLNWENESGDNIVTKDELGNTSLFDKWVKKVKTLPDGWALSGSVDIKTGEQLNTGYVSLCKGKSDDAIWKGFIENGFFKYLDGTNANVKAMKEQLRAFRDAGVGVTFGVELYVPIQYNSVQDYASMNAIQEFVAEHGSNVTDRLEVIIGRAKKVDTVVTEKNREIMAYPNAWGNIYRMNGTGTVNSGTFAYALGFASPRLFLGMLPAYSEAAVNSTTTAYDAQTFYKYDKTEQTVAANPHWVNKPKVNVPDTNRANFPGGGGWGYYSICHESTASATLNFDKEFTESISSTGKIDESVLKSMIYYTPADKVITMSKSSAPTAKEFLEALIAETGVDTSKEGGYASVLTKLAGRSAWITSNFAYCDAVKDAGYSSSKKDGVVKYALSWDTIAMGEASAQHVNYMTLSDDACSYVIVAEKKDCVALPELSDPTLQINSGYGNFIVYRFKPTSKGTYTMDSCALSELVTNQKADRKQVADIKSTKSTPDSGKGIIVDVDITNYYSVTEEEVPVKALYPEFTVMDTHKFTTTYSGEFAKLYDPAATTYAELVYTNTNRVDERVNGDDTTKEIPYDSLKDWLLDTTIPATYATAIAGEDTIKLNAPENETEYARSKTSAYINLLAGTDAASFTADKRFLRTFSGVSSFTPASNGSILAWNSDASYTDNSSINILGDEGDCTVTLTPGKTYTLDFGSKGTKKVDLNVTESDASAVEDTLTKYSDYVKNYTAYETLVANYNQRFTIALKYYQTWTEYLLSEIKDVLTSTYTMKAPALETYSYLDECSACKNGTTGRCHCEYKEESGYLKTAVTSANDDNEAKAQAAAEKLAPLATKFETVTGIQLAYSCRYDYYTGGSVSSYDSSYYNTVSQSTKNITGGTPTYDDGKSTAGIYLKYTYPTSSTANYVDYATVPTTLKSTLQTMMTKGSMLKLNGSTDSSSNVVTANSQAIAGYLGNVLKDFSEGMMEQAKLEDNRPNAEINFTTVYNHDFDPDDYFEKAVVPEYMAAKYWKNPLEFLQPGKSLLQAILDYDGRTGVTTEYTGVVNGTVNRGYNQSGALITTAGTYTDAEFGSAAFAYAGLRPARANAADSLAYSVSLAGKTTNTYKLYKDALQFMQSVKTNANNTDDALALVKDSISNANNTTQLKSAANKYSLVFDVANTKAVGDFYKGAFDALGYITESMSVWTSRWKLTTGDADRLPTKQYGADAEWTAAYNKTNLGYDTLCLEASLTTADSANLTTAAAGTKVYGVDYAKLNAASRLEDNTKMLLYKHLQIGADISAAMNYAADNVSSTLNTTDTLLMQEYTTGSLLSFGRRLSSVKTTGSLRPSWYGRTTPYKLETEFDYYVAQDMPGYDVPDSTPPDETKLEEFREEAGTHTNEHLSMNGGYGRAVKYSVYPLVKYAYDTPTGGVAYTYIAGQKARKFTGQTYFAVGIVSPNGTPIPDVIADMTVADSNASVTYGGKQTAYSGSGVMVNYDDMETSIVMQTYTLVDRDLKEKYQETWNSDDVKNFIDGHTEFLKYVGCEESTTANGVSMMALPYTAGCEVKVSPSVKYNDATAKTWNMTTGAALAIERSAGDAGSLTVDGKQYINLEVSYGELTRVYTDADNGDIVALTNSVNTVTIPAGSSWGGKTTADTFAALQRDGKGIIVRILRSMGISEDTSVADTFRATFEHSSGLTSSDIGSKYVRGLLNGVSHITGWYNEYVDCIALEFDSTAFAMEPLVFSDKIPVELGPSYDPARPFSKGYAFNAQNLMVKLLGPDDLTPPDSVEAVIDQIWKMQKHNPNESDLIIADVPVTSAH